MSHLISNRFESLCNELLLDIFEYLDAYKLCQAFYGLNHRVDALLRSAHLHILVDPSNQDKTVWNALTSFINSSRIHGLSCEYDTMEEQLLHSGKENLRFLSLYVTNRTLIEKILQLIPINNQIKCFYITEGRAYSNPNDRSLVDFILIDHAHRFTSVINLSLSSARYDVSFPNVSVIFPQLRRLSMTNCLWTSNTIEFLRANTPNLRSLHFDGYFDSTNRLSEFALTHIHELHFNYWDHFIDLQNILSMFPSLRRLHVDWTDSGWGEVVIGTQWQEVIEKYMPHLKQSTIDFENGTDEEILKIFHTGEFRLKKKVNVKMIIDKTSSRNRLVKTICFGRTWSFDYFHHLKF